MSGKLLHRGSTGKYKLLCELPANSNTFRELPLARLADLLHAPRMRGLKLVEPRLVRRVPEVPSPVTRFKHSSRNLVTLLDLLFAFSES